MAVPSDHRGRNELLPPPAPCIHPLVHHHRRRRHHHHPRYALEAHEASTRSLQATLSFASHSTSTQAMDWVGESGPMAVA